MNEWALAAIWSLFLVGVLLSAFLYFDPTGTNDVTREAWQQQHVFSVGGNSEQKNSAPPVKGEALY